MSPSLRVLIALVLALMAGLFVLTTFIPYAPARDAAAEYFPPETIETGLQFSFERRLFMWTAQGIELGLLGVLTLTGIARRWADRFLAWTGERRLPAAVLMGLCYFVLHQLLYLPIRVASYHHLRYWEMLNLEFGPWLQERSIAIGVNFVWEAIILVGLYSLLILLPRTWWLVAPLGGAALGVAFAFLSPVLINPLFNDFKPLAQTEWKHLQPRLHALARSAGVPVEEILVMDARRQSNHSNAYFTGFGPTRRIVLYDTLLINHDAQEVESVLGHEIGHWREDHIVKGILLGALAALVAFLLLDRILRAAVGRAPWQLQSTADPAGLPLILLLVFLGSWAVMPVQNVVMRQFERQADQAALELAGMPEAFKRSEISMAQKNRANVAPTPWNVWIFSTHPTSIERIRMAEEWKKRKE